MFAGRLRAANCHGKPNSSSEHSKLDFFSHSCPTPSVTRPLTALFVDCDSYFASVEQHLDPELRSRPVGVAPVLAESSCCIAASYEAITANSAVEPCGLPEWGHVGADDQVGEMPQCPRNDMAKIPCGFPPELIHPAEKVVSGQARKVPNPVLIGAFDNGVPPPPATHGCTPLALTICKRRNENARSDWRRGRGARRTPAGFDLWYPGIHHKSKRL